ncbi:MAG: TIGR03790 family protein [Verrucomicrobiota bacterium]|nr:TIGR03790 family protein [Verrucomicrobiota bacterium]
MRNKLIAAAVSIFAFTPFLARADDGSQVIVIYNTRVPESETVADHYAQVRHVPEDQILGFSLTADETMSRDEFQNSFQMPLARKLEYDGLWRFGSVTNVATNGLKQVQVRVVWSKIRYAALCYGVPLKIAPDPAWHEPRNAKVPAGLDRNEAAVDSELAWLPLAKMNIALDGPLGNWDYGATNPAALDPTNGLLLVARLDGPTPEIANALVDKALEAERDGLWGRAYFDVRNISEPSYKLGDDWIRDAAEICRQFGFETVTDEKPTTFPASFPMSQIAIYAGWYAGNVNGPFALPKVEFMPGAFAYHLHSFSAATLRSSTEHWCGPLLAKGATCTMGCVYEPYLSGTPNVAVFLARFLSGFTFGQAAWAAQPCLSWQTTVVGDPLYRPFGESPLERHAELARRKSKLIEWSFLRVADLALAHGQGIPQTADFLKNLPATTNSAVLTEKLGDLYDDLGKPASAIAAYKRALALDPSPEQRIRLRLALGEKLLAAHRDAEAANDYKALLAEAPDYPGKAGIEDKLTALSAKVAETNSAQTNAAAKP